MPASLETSRKLKLAKLLLSLSCPMAASIMARLVRSFCCERLIVKRGLYKKENSVTIQFNGSKFNVIQMAYKLSFSVTLSVINFCPIEAVL